MTDPVEQEPRRRALHDLISLDRSIPELKLELANFGWDTDQVIAELDIRSILFVFGKAIRNEVTCSDLEEWAEMIESREDIHIDQRDDGILQQIIFELANADIVVPVDDEHINEWIRVLEALGE